MRTNFRTELDADVYDDNRDSIEFNEATLLWDLEFETRDYGVKATYIYPNTLMGWLTWEEIITTSDKGDWDTKEHEEELIIDLVQNPEWEVIERVDTADGMICPGHVEIDFNRKEITIS